jgi:hypothetical protein
MRVMLSDAPRSTGIDVVEPLQWMAKNRPALGRP